MVANWPLTGRREELSIKTLAAEVIAGMLGLTLLKIDLSQVVSKWVGETEKNLETAFRQAENCQAVLFFDEADALFGKRGEVKHGMDRYANLEVGFLLQRLEQSDALVILASNLRENLDQAFTRRFHYIINFPRPEISERERIWRLVFPPEVLIAPNVDFAALVNLEMTGASISGAARSAAFLTSLGLVETASRPVATHQLHCGRRHAGRTVRPPRLGAVPLSRGDHRLRITRAAAARAAAGACHLHPAIESMSSR
jgi:SpoVK/Ycf46/Vps4 family AAA+-type ATPase